MDVSPRGGATQDAARAGASRRRILELLRAAADGLGVQQLADQAGLHANTVRFHLDRLVSEGLAERRVEERAEPGRPRLAFSATAQADLAADRRSYQLLAEILASYVAGALPDPAGAATEAGRSWGHYLATTPAPYTRVTQEQAMTGLMGILGEIGFEPEMSTADVPQVLLHHCPFLEVAAGHRDVVCSVHLGLMQGALAELRAPFTAEGLEPFVEPSLCVAHLEAATTDRAEPRS